MGTQRKKNSSNINKFSNFFYHQRKFTNMVDPCSIIKAFYYAIPSLFHYISLFLLFSSASVPWVILIKNRLWYSFQHFFGENSQQRPSDIQGFKNGSVFVSACRETNLFRLVQKLRYREDFYFQCRFLTDMQKQMCSNYFKKPQSTSRDEK